MGCTGPPQNPGRVSAPPGKESSYTNTLALEAGWHRGRSRAVAILNRVESWRSLPRFQWPDLKRRSRAWLNDSRGKQPAGAPPALVRLLMDLAATCTPPARHCCLAA